MRVDYGSAEFDERSVAPDWHTQFGQWLADAAGAQLPEPNAMLLATADAAGRPSARTVLLRGYGTDGFVFFTNYESRKSQELAANPYASLVFPWFAIRRQVVVTGRVERVSRGQTEAYFASRPRESQLGAWASPQSRPVPDRAALDEAWRETAQRFPEGQPVPAPPHWGGYRLAPETVEFWQGRTARMHDRLRFRRTGDGWLLERLAP
ncbi:MAG: pyridoxamine 5'-phosphate oxidase [Micromonosporaceae bacterium]|nr:pyridoxamine 5'-phosphate oxidase [Micromonosporaceae bacterium]